MTWKLLFARDSFLWVVLFYAGMAVVLVAGLIEKPEDYGISAVGFRWLKLFAAVITGISGKSGLSWSPSSREIQMGSKT